MEWDEVFQLEVTYNKHLIQLPDQFRADQKLKHVIKEIAQMPLKHWQAWGTDHPSRKPLPVFDHPLSAEMLPGIVSCTSQYPQQNVMHFTGV